MKTGGGDFSAEAYEQLREAYSSEQQKAVDDELKGTQVMGMEYGLETLPVDSPWSDKIENWEYPSGKGQYIDEHQSPDEILEIMRGAAQERIDAKKEEEEEEEITEEEFDKSIEELLSDDEDEDEDEDDEADENDEDEVEEEPSAEVEEEPVAESEPEVEEEEEEFDPEELAAQIAELRAEIEGLSFITESQTEESEDDEQHGSDAE